MRRFEAGRWLPRPSALCLKPARTRSRTLPPQRRERRAGRRPPFSAANLPCRPPPRPSRPAPRRKGESKDLIARLLGDQVKCYTTPCVQHELKKLGKEVAGGGRPCAEASSGGAAQSVNAFIKKVLYFPSRRRFASSPAARMQSVWPARRGS